MPPKWNAGLSMANTPRSTSPGATSAPFASHDLVAVLPVARQGRARRCGRRPCAALRSAGARRAPPGGRQRSSLPPARSCGPRRYCAAANLAPPLVTLNSFQGPSLPTRLRSLDAQWFLKRVQHDGVRKPCCRHAHAQPSTPRARRVSTSRQAMRIATPISTCVVICERCGEVRDGAVDLDPAVHRPRDASPAPQAPRFTSRSGVRP